MHSYPDVYNVGHRAVAELFTDAGDLVVQEKIDGSQFSFGVVDGRVGMRSKGAELFPESKDKLFRPAIETVLRLFADGKLHDGWTYRGETLMRPKHNTLAYDRVPQGHVILFDVDQAEETYVEGNALLATAADLELETVPTLYVGPVTDLTQLQGFLDRVSVLGGSKIEGVVLKAYGRFGSDKKTLMAKYVSEAFKEVHRSDWKERNPGRGDILERLIATYRTPARWAKAV